MENQNKITINTLPASAMSNGFQKTHLPLARSTQLSMYFKLTKTNPFKYSTTKYCTIQYIITVISQKLKNLRIPVSHNKKQAAVLSIRYNPLEDCIAFFSYNTTVHVRKLNAIRLNNSPILLITFYYF